MELIFSNPKLSLRESKSQSRREKTEQDNADHKAIRELIIIEQINLILNISMFHSALLELTSLTKTKRSVNEALNIACLYIIQHNFPQGKVLLLAYKV